MRHEFSIRVHYVWFLAPMFLSVYAGFGLLRSQPKNRVNFGCSSPCASACYGVRAICLAALAFTACEADRGPASRPVAQPIESSYDAAPRTPLPQRPYLVFELEQKIHLHSASVDSLELRYQGEHWKARFHQRLGLSKGGVREMFERCSLWFEIDDPELDQQLAAISALNTNCKRHEARKICAALQYVAASPTGAEFCQGEP